MASHPIPPDLAGSGRAREVRERTFAVLRRILATPGRDRDRQKASDYYAACMDEASIEAKGLAPLQSVLSRIAALNSRDELPALLGYLHGVASQPDIPLRQPSYAALFEFRSEHGIPFQTAVLDQGGTSLPDRRLYISTDGRTLLLRDGFRDHVGKMLAMLGASSAEATAGARAVLAIETTLAMASADVVEQRARGKYLMSLAELQAMTPHFDWSAYLAATPAPTISTIDLYVPAFARAIDTIVAATPISDLRHYLQWQVAHASVVMMPASFRQADVDFFKRALRGQQQLEPRSQLCVTETDDRLGDVLGRAFVEETFAPRAKKDIEEMVGAIKAAMGQEIDTASWMSAETKREAKAKLAAIVARIGYPSRWRNYSTLQVKKGDALGNRQRALVFEKEADLRKIGRPIDSEQWPPRLTASRAEAVNTAERNEIIFPAGFFQPPLYGVSRDPAANYGGIGAVIGHEVTHGFDDVGRRLDAQGKRRNWWGENDAKAFGERAACLSDQYSQYAIADGTKVNGHLTLGENIADSGGLRLALAAYLAGPGAAAGTEIVDGFTPTQRFFLSWGQVWCANVRPEAERLQVTTDPHSPNRHRVNGPLSNMPEFGRAFSCKPDAPMVRQSACRVW